MVKYRFIGYKIYPMGRYSSVLILSGVVYAPGSLFDYPELFLLT